MVLAKWKPFSCSAACRGNFTDAICLQLLAWLKAHTHCGQCALDALCGEEKADHIMCVDIKKWNSPPCKHDYHTRDMVIIRESYWNVPQLATTHMHIAHHMTSSLEKAAVSLAFVMGPVEIMSGQSIAWLNSNSRLHWRSLSVSGPDRFITWFHFLSRSQPPTVALGLNYVADKSNKQILGAIGQQADIWERTGTDSRVTADSSMVSFLMLM